jgi:hypothetical protein
MCESADVISRRALSPILSRLGKIVESAVKSGVEGRFVRKIGGVQIPSERRSDKRERTCSRWVVRALTVPLCRFRYAKRAHGRSQRDEIELQTETARTQRHPSFDKSDAGRTQPPGE